MGQDGDAVLDLKRLESLNERFARPGAVRFEAGSGGLVRGVSMCCVETATAADNAVRLTGGERHTMAVVIRAMTA